MNLDYDAQREFCERLGLITPDDSRGALWDSPECQDVCRLLRAMETQAARMAAAKGWLTSALADDDRRFAESDDVHSVTSIGNAARHALDYDSAAAAYTALQEQLQQIVVGIRSAQGYEPRAFDRLEDHPALSPAQDRARRELAALHDHLGKHGMTRAGMRRHLAEVHHRQVTRVPGADQDREAAGLNLIHEHAHADDLAACEARLAGIDPALLASAR